MTKDEIQLYMDGVSYAVHSTEDNYKPVSHMLLAFDQWEDEDSVSHLVHSLKKLLDRKVKFENYLKDSPITIENGLIKYKDTVIRSAIVDRLEEVIDQQGDWKGIVKFIENMMENPSPQSVNELYLFLEHNNLPITEDGCFLAYKKVIRNEEGILVDIYTRSINNSPGEIIEMDRDKVDPDRYMTCSYGFHVCSYDYLPHYGMLEGDVAVLVKVNPKDVVTVPADYNNAKMRVCKYKVVKIIEDWKNTKIKDYFVSDGDYLIYDDDADREEEYEEKEDYYNYWLENEYGLTENDGVKYLENFSVLYQKASWQHINNDYRGYILTTIEADETVDDAIDRIGNMEFMENYRIRNGVRHKHATSYKRYLVACVEKNGKKLSVPELLAPSVERVDKSS